MQGVIKISVSIYWARCHMLLCSCTDASTEMEWQKGSAWQRAPLCCCLAKTATMLRRALLPPHTHARMHTLTHILGRALETFILKYLYLAAGRHSHSPPLSSSSPPLASLFPQSSKDNTRNKENPKKD